MGEPGWHQGRRRCVCCPVVACYLTVHCSRPSTRYAACRRLNSSVRLAVYERPTGSVEPPAGGGLECQFAPDYDPFAIAGSYHRPNTFSKRERIVNTLLAVMLIAYGTCGIMAGNLYVPGKYTSGVNLQGVAAWLMYGAILSGSASLLSVVVDHYDRRNNELMYASFKRFTSRLGWLLLMSAGLYHVWLGFKP